MVVRFCQRILIQAAVMFHSEGATAYPTIDQSFSACLLYVGLVCNYDNDTDTSQEMRT